MVEGATPWGAMLRTACGLGLGPELFWRLSLREWRMLTETANGGRGLARGEFERLIAAWPDGEDPG